MDFNKTTAKVNNLKREKKHNEALALLHTYITTYEAGKEEPRSTSWAYQQAAIIYRKEKRYDDEIAIINQYARRHLITSKSAHNLIKRLEKAYPLAGRAEKRTIDGQQIIYCLDEQMPLDQLPIFIRHGLVVDVETTGLTKQDEIIELGAILFSYNQYTGTVLDIEETYNGLRQPSVPIHQDAASKHNINPRKLKGQRLDKTRITNLIDQADIIVAHNASFDYRFLVQLFPHTENKTWYCTMNGIDWKKKGHASKTLSKLTAAYNIAPETTHRGLEDAQSTLSLTQQTNPDTGETFLLEMLCSRPYTTQATKPYATLHAPLSDSHSPDEKKSKLRILGILIMFVAAPVVCVLTGGEDIGVLLCGIIGIVGVSLFIYATIKSKTAD